MKTPIPKIYRRLSIVAWIFITSTAALPGGLLASEPAFSNLFSDHMVFQRERPLNIWGTASPGEKLHVSLGKLVRSTRADEFGNWTMEFPALAAGGPHRLELAGENGAVRILEDILIGEVWLCSGQSNMEYPLAHLNEPWREAGNVDSSIRFLTVGHESSTQPLAQFKDDSGWDVATSESVTSFSAACYLFARSLQQEMDVPFGLINASWGGSAIEAWISARGLQNQENFTRSLELNDIYDRDSSRALHAFVNDWQTWWKAAGGEQPAPWTKDFDDVDWTQWDGLGTNDNTGMTWYRKSFELNAAEASRDALLELGGVDEVDVTWINETAVGAMFGWGIPRNYRLEPDILTAGTNVLAVNVYNSWAAGGLEGPSESIRLVLSGGSHIPLGDGWKIQHVTQPAIRPPMTPWSSTTGVTGLFNAMIAPLVGFEFAGVLWYQGESNADRSQSYEGLLSTMIADWRRSLGENLPFIVVQLPEFGSLPAGPADSGWARMRHAQQRVAVADPLTGLAVTIGSGDPVDIHPPNKRVVGARAAAVATSLLLGREAIPDGIVPLRALLSGNEVTVHFAETGTPLFVSGAASPSSFELCDNRGACRYVAARLEQDHVVLDASEMDEPAEVRHAWADVPLINLYSSKGLPVSSFSLPVEGTSH